MSFGGATAQLQLFVTMRNGANAARARYLKENQKSGVLCVTDQTSRLTGIFFRRCVAPEGGPVVCVTLVHTGFCTTLTEVLQGSGRTRGCRCLSSAGCATGWIRGDDEELGTAPRVRQGVGGNLAVCGASVPETDSGVSGGGDSSSAGADSGRSLQGEEAGDSPL